MLKKGKVPKKDKAPKECPDCKVPLWCCEIPEKYDGVSYYNCPKCGRTWDRWTGEEVKNEN